MSSAEREPIAVIGTGYVGLVTAAGFAELGNEVWCVDIDAAKIERLKQGQVPIYEPGLSDVIVTHSRRIHFTTDLSEAVAHARLLFVAVGTPPTYSGDADLSAVNAVVNALPVSDQHVLVMKSTVPVGTGATIRRTLQKTGKGGYSYVSCPEFLKEGAALDDFRHPDRIVVGDSGDWGGDAVVKLYAPLNSPLVRTDIASAEMIKLAANAFLATKISFINEIANVCEETGADVAEVAKGMGLDQRIGPHFLKAGLGFGGSCLPGHETVLVRMRGRTTLMSFEQLWNSLEADHDVDDGVIEPRNVSVLSYIPGEAEPAFMPVMQATKRPYDGDVVRVKTKTGRRVTTTADHPWIVGNGESGDQQVKEAGRLTDEDWVPLPVGLDRERALVPVGAHAAQAVPRSATAAEAASQWELSETGRRDLLAIEFGIADPARPGEQFATNDPAMADRALRLLASVGQIASLEVVDRGSDEHFTVRTGLGEYRQFGEDHTGWVRITDTCTEHFAGDVYSLEVAAAHTFVTTGGIAVHNCFPKDVTALKQIAGNSGYHFQLLTSVIEVNELQKRRVVGKLQKHLGTLVGKQIALLGLAFKAHTDDMREASSLVLSARLQGAGAQVRAYDPVAMDAARPLMPGVEFAQSTIDAVSGADAIVLVTEWPQFKELDWDEVAGVAAGKVLIDGRNFIDAETAQAAGFVYEGIGR